VPASLSASKHRTSLRVGGKVVDLASWLCGPLTPTVGTVTVRVRERVIPGSGRRRRAVFWLSLWTIEVVCWVRTP